MCADRIRSVIDVLLVDQRYNWNQQLTAARAIHSQMINIYIREQTSPKASNLKQKLSRIQTQLSGLIRIRHGSESRFLPTTPAFDALVRGGGFPLQYRHPVWYGKTRMVWLPDGEKISKISLFVFTQSTNVTDTHTHTDTAWRHRPHLCIASRGKNASFTSAVNCKIWYGLSHPVFLASVVFSRLTTGYTVVVSIVYFRQRRR